MAPAVENALELWRLLPARTGRVEHYSWRREHLTSDMEDRCGVGTQR